MTDQDNGQVSTLQRPISDDPEAWKTYWNSRGWPWRTDPEIDAERQKYLAERRSVTPNIDRGIYPFKDIKLSRADVEWLLATHENGRGPVDWADENQRGRWGLDLRGADLRTINLAFLPLARLRAGLKSEERPMTENRIRYNKMAATHLENTNLYEAHLEGAILCWTRLEDASLEFAYLELADFTDAHLEGTSFRRSHLEGASLRFAFFNVASNLNYASLCNKELGCILVGDTNWDSINLTMINWLQVNMLGDERKARQKIFEENKENDTTPLSEYRVAVRANRQLAVALQAQGLNEEAARFAYRAQVLQRIVLRLQKKFGSYLFSGFLDLLAGYGYRPGRSVIWYLVTILGFALAYFAIGHLPVWPDAIVYSLTSFHGRGFLPSLDGQIVTLHYPLVVMAAFEAVIGLLIEISFIATFTQRFFGR